AAGRAIAAAKTLNIAVGVAVFAVAVVADGSARANDRLGRDLVRKSEAGAEPVLPNVLENVAAAASGACAGELEGAGVTLCPGIRNGRVEVTVLAMLLEAREWQVVSQADVQRQLFAELDVVLVIPRVVTEDEIDVGAEA